MKIKCSKLIRRLMVKSLPPKEELFWRIPEDGWKPHTWYLAEASVGTGNPIHRVILYTGFLNEDGEPSGYSGITQTNFIENSPVCEYKYLYPLRVLLEENDPSQFYSEDEEPDWFICNGNESHDTPIVAGVNIDVEFRDGVSENNISSKGLRFCWIGSDCDIMKWRYVK